AFYCEIPPKTASVVWDPSGKWEDSEWMKTRYEKNSLKSPVSIYELHIGSWDRVAEEGYRQLTYAELAERLAEYIKKAGFTHVEFMPVMEHPFYGSWGYQVTGYFAPTARYGSPRDLMHLIDMLHKNGIGVILDWVPSHFPNDRHGLAFFDGTELFEHQDPKKGFHPDWKSLIFNYGRNEVREFLISSALFWLDRYHADGLRIDAVASMLYLDYSRKEGQWIPNKYGGRENLEAMEFIRELNKVVYANYPDVQTIAEESTAWPAVTKPVYTGGLGFGMKWNMGWMHDTLQYFTKDPVYRKFHHSELTFTSWYAFFENFVLPLSHDEVVHGKKSLIEKMPGDIWQKFANLRLLFSYMYGFPGKKLLFMGDDIGQWGEWHHDQSVEWNCLENEFSSGLQKLISDLNNLYRNERALYENDFTPESFECIDFEDRQQSALFFLRKTSSTLIIIACNFTPTPRYKYRIGVPAGGIWKEIFNSDAKEYGGSGHGNFGRVKADRISSHGRNFSVLITLPPLGVIFFKKETKKKTE
ncbi:MAG: 1,4-alpha-glucan branching protein GlgB, partial [Actinobacteria bacterium]|nr:1,4-alpha-glucan branching protein GlgB [Actinomycetota bacterium]